MGMESFNNPPAPQEKTEEEKKAEEKEQAFSSEGLLNRNFGKDVEKPSEALFFKGGILNRPKYQENITQQREEREKKDAEKIQEIRKNLGIATEKTDDGVEKPFSPEGLLNRNFGKNRENLDGPIT